MDDDGNKQLSKEELTDGLTELGLDMAENEIDEIMSKLDADDSGGISLTEFIVAVRVSLLYINSLFYYHIKNFPNCIIK